MPAISIAEMRELVAETSEDTSNACIAPTFTASWRSSRRRTS